VPAGGSRIGDRGIDAVMFAILGALAGGLLLNLMPCVFPILALKALHLAKSGGSKREARRDALAYTAGAVIGTGLLGTCAIGDPGRRKCGRMGIPAAGLRERPSCYCCWRWRSRSTCCGRSSSRCWRANINPGGSFGTGALAAFVATPCAGPFLGAALGTALLLPIYGSVAVFAALGLGLAIPFLAIAFIPALRTRLPQPGAWMVRLQRFLAIPMAATAAGCLWLLYRQAGMTALAAALIAVALLSLLLFWTGFRQRKGAPAGWAVLTMVVVLTGAAALLVPRQQPSALRVPLGTEAWSEAAVARYRSEGRPLFVYFTADWCLTCKANEAAAIEREAVRDAFGKAGVKVLVGDWTNGDPAITRFWRAGAGQGCRYIFGTSRGIVEPEELPQVLTPGMLTQRAQSKM
jgi:thiol:disulfide interchange protein